MTLRVGVLTGGGDAPGLNAAICGLGRRIAGAGGTLVGFRDGWRGLIEDEVVALDPDGFQHLLVLGGTVLGSSSANPYREPGRDLPRLRATFAARQLNALVAIGGDGTLGAADRLWREEQLPMVAVPKTIDNDLSATDFTFGFFSAVEVATQAMDDLRTTAESHGRVMVVECMGRHAGWITAYAGVAAGAEAVVVPERDTHIEELCDRLQGVRRQGRRAAIVAAAEGARLFEDGRCLSSAEKDEYGGYLTGGVGEILARRIQARLGWESRHLVLGHLQRAGRPIAFDRIFALRLGAKAGRLVMERRFGRMAALRNGEVVDVALADAVAQRKTLQDQFLDRYEHFFLPISSPA